MTEAIEKKVSIITPCYNGEQHLHYFLDSILNQTYSNIEFIFINDGSTDKTEEIVKSYEPAFVKKGMVFRYVYQRNQGLAASLNNGLKLFTGDYLTWPDSDDMLTPDSIEKKVKFLEENRQYGFVRTDGIIVSEYDKETVLSYYSNKDAGRFKEKIFDNLLLSKNIWPYCNSYMLRTSAFVDVNPLKKIYNSKLGQNLQMLLPIAYKYKCGFIDENLCSYVLREGSHSHELRKGYITYIMRESFHLDLLKNIITEINGINIEKYNELIDSNLSTRCDKDHYKTLCYGCGACANICKSNALRMEEDDEGFLYPKYILDNCNFCNACINVCPGANKNFKPKRSATNLAIAARSKEFALLSTSGGVFPLLAKQVLIKDGYVAGAVFNNEWKIDHIISNDTKDLERMRGSKYLQSNNKDIFIKVKEILDVKKIVLFTGTPCQIAELYGFLGKDYNNLITIDLVCNSVNSPMVWGKYLDEISEGQKIHTISFRNKAKNIPNFEFNLGTEYFNINYENGKKFVNISYENLFMIGFYNHFYMRPCCSACPYSGRIRPGDITLGDLQPVEYKEYRKEGISQILINSQKGKLLFKTVIPELSEVHFLNLNRFKEQVPNLNGKPFAHHPKRGRFFDLIKNISFSQTLDHITKNKYDIGIVGMHAPNYGNLLTAYAMYNIITNMGYSALMLDRPMTSIDKPSLDNFKYFNKNPYPDYSISGIYADKNSMIELNNRIKMFLLPSDQVLRPLLFKDYDKYTLLDWVFDSKPKIAYASSFGTEFFEGDEELRAEMSFFLNRFDAFSVREESGVKYAKDNFNINAEQVLDPVFLCNPEVYHQMILGNEFRIPEAPFLGCYLLFPSKLKLEMMDQVLEDLQLTRTCFITAPVYTAEYIHSMYEKEYLKSACVEELLACVENSAFFLTDSFHGICFSVIMKKQFFVLFDIETQNKVATRIYGFLDKLNLVDRIITDYNEIKERKLLDNQIDFNRVYEILNTEIKRSYNWLYDNINKVYDIKKNNSVYDIMNKQNEIIDNKIKMLQNKINEENVKIEHKFNEVIDRLNQFNNSFINLFENSNNNIIELERKVELIRYYSIGNKWLFRKVRGFFRHIKNDGVVFTLILFLKKVYRYLKRKFI